MPKHFRILRVCTGDQTQIEDYYHNNGFQKLPYNEQLEKFQEANYILPGSWSASMNSLGNECTDLLLNATSMQKTWCAENNINIDFTKEDWAYQVLRVKIADYRPDVLFFYAGVFTWFSEEQRTRLRDDFPFLKLITGLWGDELSGYANYSKVFSDVDLIFTNTELTRDVLVSAGITALVLGNCFDNVTAEPKIPPHSSLADQYHVVFLGATGFGCDLHRQRYMNVLSMMRKTDMEVWTNEPDPKQKKNKNSSYLQKAAKLPLKYIGKGALSTLSTARLQRLKQHRSMNWKVAKYIDEITMRRSGVPIRGKFYLDKQKIAMLYPDRCHPFLESWSDYFEVMRRSKFVFNAHRDELSDYSNIRVFEATGVGSCLITDRGNEMKKFFDIDNEIVTFESVDEAIEKLEYLDSHDNVRVEIARAGQRRTLADHTVQKRCEAIHEIICEFI